MESLNDLKSWPFVEARRLIKHTEDKDEVVFATGYGPSGPPHIGTFGEVARTTMVMNAFRQLSDKPMRLIVFSDDMDALRSIPDNIMNPNNILDDYIGVSLSSVPDTYGEYDGELVEPCHDSYSEHNNAALREFLDYHGFEYEFMSSTECYKSGMFNETLKLVALRATEVKDIVTKDYGIKGGNRKESYCPFIYVDPESNQQTFEMYDWSVCTFNTDAPLMLHFFTDPVDSHLGDSRVAKMESLFNGNMKCQWKVDWPMRWIALGVDYEMHGKDLIGSAQVGRRICKLLGKKAPLNYMYELFLDEEGSKISKSKGNGLELQEWMHFSTPEVVSYYMFQNPRKSRKLHFGVIPQMTDDYLKMLDKYNTAPSMDNPVWHVHKGDVPETGSPVMFSMLLNLVGITNTEDPEMLLKFVQNYVPDASFEKYPMLRDLIGKALNYYEMKVLPLKNYRAPTEMERVALISLHGSLRLLQEQHNAMLEHMQTNNAKVKEVEGFGGEQAILEESITSIVYDIGKQFFGEEKDSLRNYFKMVYEVIMGQTSGPRLPVFIMMLGINEFARLLKEKIK